MNKTSNKLYFCGILQGTIYTVILTSIIIFLIFDTAGSRERWISFGGIVIIVTFGWIFSKHPDQVNWRTVLSGFIIQFIFGLITIRWSVGRAIFQCISKKVETFLNFVKVGARFAYSDVLVDSGVFVFSALPAIFFFSFIIQMLYHSGVLQKAILKLGWALQTLMGTTVCESMNAAGNTFLGMC
ncbi:sodium/nucleoside cotransporter 2-like [Belonocnema kinseyi]|uniref:sodium/nucleoside cotransporter 2-like n=1 Tax=Belonocnema kinseyi TaxID=2817044 RepID=UPI00143D52E3|nr:sodium/nucleoside cotransporter 2-like [Belonocnema kinseyi]